MLYICYDGTNDVMNEECIPDIVEEWNNAIELANDEFNPDGSLRESGRDIRKRKLIRFIELFTRNWPP